jgi:hypothetical protein
MLWAVEVLTVVASEGQVNFEPAHFTFQELRLPDCSEYWCMFQLLILVPHIVMGRNVAQMHNVRKGIR